MSTAVDPTQLGSANVSRTNWLRGAIRRIRTPLPKRICQIVIAAGLSVAAIDVVIATIGIAFDPHSWLYPIGMSLFAFGSIEFWLRRYHDNKQQQARGGEPPA